jgi:hypothetical protein
MRRLKEKFGQPEQAAPITLKYTRRRDPDQTLQSQQRIFYKIYRNKNYRHHYLTK